MQVSHLLERLCDSSSADLDKIAELEFVFHNLVHHFYRPRGLITLVAQRPTVFCKLLKLAYRADRPTEEIAEEDPRARIAYELLGTGGFRSWSLTEAVSIEDLPKWIEAVVDWGKENGYTKATGYGVAVTLARTVSGSDGVWPQTAVCELLEGYRELHDLSQTICVSRMNLRGVTGRRPGSGGALERAEATQYRAWAKARMSYPTVHQLLLNLASWSDQDAEREDERDGLRQDLG